MRFVLDTSDAFKWLVPEADSDKANRLRDEFRAATHELIAPDFFHVELAHALTRAERQGRIAVGDASLLWSDAMTTPPDLVPSLSLTGRAIAISAPHRVAVYDCVYVALAEQEGCEFVTADDRLVKVLQPQFLFIRSLASLP
jgi:predicted nucleic acid-binding protein